MSGTPATAASQITPDKASERECEHPPDLRLWHLLQVVMSLGSNYPIRKVFQFNEIDNVMEFMTLDENEIKELDYLAVNQVEKLDKPSIRKVKKLWQFARYEYQRDNEVSWTEMTPQDIQYYLVEILAKGTTSQLETKMVAKFKEGVKVDVKAYPQWNGLPSTWLTFKRKVLAVANTHQLGDVFDREFVIPRDDTPARELFRAKNEFVLSIWSGRISGGSAMTVIRRYSHHSDGRGVFFCLIDEFESQQNLDGAAMIALRNIHSLKLVYKGISVPEYISKFRDYLMDLEDAGQPMQDAMARTMVLQQVQDKNYSFIMDSALKDKNMHHEDIFTCLMDKYNQLNPGGKTQRQVYQTTVKKGKQKQGHSDFIPKEKWMKMSSEEKEAVLKKRQEKRTGKLPVPKSNYSKSVINKLAKNVSKMLVATMKDTATEKDDVKETERTAKVNNATQRESQEDFGIDALRQLLRTQTQRSHVNNVRRVRLGITQEHIQKGQGAVDGGADSSLIGSEWNIESYTDRKVDLEGFEGTRRVIEGVPVGSGITAVEAENGTILLRANEAAAMPTGKTLLSANQMRHKGHEVYDTPKRYHGRQEIILHSWGDNVRIPLQYKAWISENPPKMNCRVVKYLILHHPYHGIQQ